MLSILIILGLGLIGNGHSSARPSKDRTKPTSTTTAPLEEAPSQAAEEQELPVEDGVAVLAPQTAEWVVRAPNWNGIRNLGRQPALKGLVEDVKFPVSLPTLQSCLYASGFNPREVLGGLPDVLEDNLVLVGIGHDAAGGMYLYTRVSAETWELWEAQRLRGPQTVWKQREDEVYVYQPHLLLPFATIDESLLIFYERGFMCMALGNDAMDAFRAVLATPAEALRVAEYAARPSQIAVYWHLQSASEGASPVKMVLPELVREHPLVSNVVAGVPKGRVEGIITVARDETVLDLRFEPESPTVFTNGDLSIPAAIPGDAISFDIIHVHLPELLEKVTTRNLEDSDFAQRVYTQFYAKHQFWPLDGVGSMLGTKGFRFSVPSKSQQEGDATVYVWNVVDGPLAAETLATILRAESGTALGVRAMRRGDHFLYQATIDGKTWNLIGVDERILLTDELAALARTEGESSLSDSVSLPEDFGSGRCLLFYRNENAKPQSKEMPLDLPLAQELAWYFARAYPYRLGRAQIDADGRFVLQSWLRF